MPLNRFYSKPMTVVMIVCACILALLTSMTFIKILCACIILLMALNSLYPMTFSKSCVFTMLQMVCGGGLFVYFAYYIFHDDNIVFQADLVSCIVVICFLIPVVEFIRIIIRTHCNRQRKTSLFQVNPQEIEEIIVMQEDILGPGTYSILIKTKGAGERLFLGRRQVLKIADSLEGTLPSVSQEIRDIVKQDLLFNNSATVYPNNEKISSQIESNGTSNGIRNWSTPENKLIVNGEEVAVFPYPVRSAKEIQDTIVVILDVPDNIAFSRNAYGYILPEKRLWQIDKYYPHEPSCDIRVMSICRQDDIIGQVLLWTWTCIVLYVDIKTGKIIRTELSR